MPVARLSGWMCVTLLAICPIGPIGCGDEGGSDGDGDGDTGDGDTGDGDGDTGDGDGDTGDGDGDFGDGDGDTGDGDGDFGDGDGDGDIATPTWPEVGRVLEAIDARSCSIARRCEALLDPSVRDELGAACAPGERQLGAALAYEEELARDCLLALATEVLEGCHPRPPLPAACDGVIHGTVASGSDCDSHAICEPPLVCLGLPSACGGTCVPQAKLGEECNRFDRECEAGTICFEYSCVAADCHGDFDCEAGEYCDAGGGCQDRPTDGQTCLPVAGIWPCAGDLVCGGTQGGAWLCYEGEPAGSPCSDATCDSGTECGRMPCAVGLRCVAGTCEGIAELDANCNSLQCPLGMVCDPVMGDCEPRPALGEECSPGRCFDGLCEDGICTLGAVGDVCVGRTIAPECEGHCLEVENEGRSCADLFSSGTECTDNQQCAAGLVCDNTCTAPICD